MKSDEEFGGLTVEARRITVNAARVRSESFEIAMPQSAADRAARRALFEEWTGREEATFALPPSMLALDATDVIRIQHDGRTPEYQLARVTDGVIKFMTVRVDEELKKAERRKARRLAEEARRRERGVGRSAPAAEEVEL